jgi:uncharacterized Zn finger protein (UPF0148 family)
MGSSMICPRCGTQLIWHDDGCQFCPECPCVLELTRTEGWVDIGEEEILGGAVYENTWS